MAQLGRCLLQKQKKLSVNSPNPCLKTTECGSTHLCWRDRDREVDLRGSLSSSLIHAFELSERPYLKNMVDSA